MEWATVQTALVSAVQTALGDVEADVTWIDKTNGWRNESNVKLQLLTLVPRGRDERRYTDDGDDDMIERVYGVRRFVVSIRCETQDQDLVDTGMARADTISARLHGSDVEAILDTAEIGIASVQPIRQVNAPDGHDRVRSIAILDVRFNASTSVTGPTVPRLRAVEITGTVENGPDVGPTEISETGWTGS